MKTAYWSLALAGAVVTGCESSPALPSEVGDEPAFTRITFDMRTLTPQPGASFVPGDVFEYSVAASWEFTDADWAAFQSDPDQAEVSVALYQWSSHPVYGRTWEGTIGDTLIKRPNVERTGTVEFSGSLTVPQSGLQCGAYDAISADAAIFIGFNYEPSQGSDKSGGNAFGTRYEVEGGRRAVGPCLGGGIYWERRPAWGGELQLTLHNVDNTREIEVLIGERPAPVEERHFSIREREPGRLDSLSWVVVTIPPGSAGGIVTARVDGEPAEQGGVPTRLAVASRVDDPHDPGNDDWRTAASAPADTLPVVVMFEHALALTETDRVPDPARNPFGTSDHGVGDWWRLDVPSAMTLCVKAFRDVDDEIDLFLTDEGGTPVETQRFSREGWEALAGPSAQPGETYLLWVAPKAISSALGAYTLTVADCVFFTPRQGFPPELQGVKQALTGGYE